MDTQEKYIAIGDIHGCIDQLNEMLILLQEYHEHTLVFLGDYISRGPNPEAVVQRLQKLPNAIFLRGNHEDDLIGVVEKRRSQTEKQEYIDKKRISNESYSWLRDTVRFYHETDHYFFVHAGLNNAKTMEQQDLTDLLWCKYSTEDFSAVTPKLVIRGHTRFAQPLVLPHSIAIDTGCGSGGYLTALVLPEMEFIQSLTPSKARQE